eukprot:365534-Chlamydomonas_euryale.AAC.11
MHGRPHATSTWHCRPPRCTALQATHLFLLGVGVHALELSVQRIRLRFVHVARRCGEACAPDATTNWQRTHTPMPGFSLSLYASVGTALIRPMQAPLERRPIRRPAWSL